MTTAADIRQQIDDALERLTLADQEKVLAFIRELQTPHGIPPQDLLAFFRQFPQAEAQEAARFIEAAHEEEARRIERELDVSHEQ